MIECTSKPDLIIKAKQRTYEMTESFAKLVYDAFDPANAHHWQNQIDWFHREVRFVDAESASIGKKHALNEYDQFALNTSCFWRKYQVKYYPSCAIS